MRCLFKLGTCNHGKASVKCNETKHCLVYYITAFASIHKNMQVQDNVYQVKESHCTSEVIACKNNPILNHFCSH